MVSLGINLVASSLVNFFENGISGIFGNTLFVAISADFFSLIFGLGLTAICLAILFTYKMQESDRNFEIDGFFMYNKEKKELLSIDRYGISEEMARLLTAAVKENPDIRKIWETKAITHLDDSQNPSQILDSSSQAIIRELIEYIVLAKLSNTLTNYFNKKDIDEKELVKFQRKDIPGILLENRFLALFSKPMEERAAFIGDSTHPRPNVQPATFTSNSVRNDGPKDRYTLKIEEFEMDEKKRKNPADSSGKIVYMDQDGRIFSNFELILPRNSKVSRIDGRIKIESEGMEIILGNEFIGYASFPPAGFERDYLSIPRDKRKYFEAYAIKISIDVKFGVISRITGRAYTYNAWLDGYIERLDVMVNKKRFFHNIRWDSVQALLHCIDVRNTRKKTAEESESQLGGISKVGLRDEKKDNPHSQSLGVDSPQTLSEKNQNDPNSPKK